jgi:hypothetical protein
MLRLVQLRHPARGRAVAVASADELQLLAGVDSVFRLVEAAAQTDQGLAETARAACGKERLEYGPVYESKSEWRLLPPLDHPDEPARCLVTGTGLTHKASALNRQAMHTAKTGPVTDSLRMFEWGLAGGRPEAGRIGVQPEWFYKGCGTRLRAHGEPLETPCFAMDGGEEAEVAGAYWIDSAGRPRRIGLVQGNEFSDHRLESQNYLYLAHSKLRACALGPELVVEPEFEDVRGAVRVKRGGSVVWSKPFVTGEANMCHSLANLEHHHFKYPAHRRPGDLHLHFLGTDAFSFGEGVELADGDIMETELPGFGRPLRNPVRIDRAEPKLVAVEPL